LQTELFRRLYQPQLLEMHFQEMHRLNLAKHAWHCGRLSRLDWRDLVSA
jgi:hypothetical protein